LTTKTKKQDIAASVFVTKQYEEAKSHEAIVGKAAEKAKYLVGQNVFDEMIIWEM